MEQNGKKGMFAYRKVIVAIEVAGRKISTRRKEMSKLDHSDDIIKKELRKRNDDIHELDELTRDVCIFSGAIISLGFVVLVAIINGMFVKGLIATVVIVALAFGIHLFLTGYHKAAEFVARKIIKSRKKGGKW